MKKQVVRTISMFVLCTLLAASTMACNKKDPAPATQQNQTSTSTAKPESNTPKTPEEILASGDLIKPDSSIKWPLSEKTITLKFMKPYLTYDANTKDLAILQDYEKKTNVKIEWDTPPSANFTEKFNLAMNTGNLPDAIIGAVATDIEKYGQQGAYLDLKSIIEKDMPNLKKALAKYPTAKKVVTNDDGKMYSLPYIYQFTAGNNVMMIREDLLKKYKLNMPTTTDEWYNVMKVFKEKENMTPFSGFGANGLGMNAAISMISAFGVFPEGLYVAEKLYPNDNKVHYGPIESRYKEGIEWLKKLYSEGLIDPEIVTNDQKAFQAKALQNKIGIWRGWINSDLAVLNDTAAKEGKTVDQFYISEAPIMKGPHGDQFHMWPDNMVLQNGFVISSKNKYPSETAKWADYWYSDVGQTYVYGVEGVTYTKEKDGTVKWTDWVLKNPGGKSMNEARGAVTFGRGVWPTIFQPWSLTSATVKEEIEVNRKKYRDTTKFVYPMPVGLSFSKEENTFYSQKMTDIQTYVDQSLLNFILGKTPMSEWDNYVATVKKMGMDQIITNYQKSYERYQKR